MAMSEANPVLDKWQRASKDEMTWSLVALGRKELRSEVMVRSSQSPSDIKYQFSN